jgi:hypothetical protein
LEEAVEEIQLAPLSTYWQGQLALYIDKLQRFEKRKAEGQRLRSKIKWKKVKDQCSKEFFQANRKRSTASHITELKDKQGQVHISQAVLQHICQEYYSTLYTARTETLMTIGAKAQVLNYLSDKPTLAMKDKLRLPLQVGELKTAIDNMCTGKSPGADGIVLEFY